MTSRLKASARGVGGSSRFTQAALPVAALTLALAGSNPSVGPAAAADYPVRPVRVVMPNAPGAAPDTVARILTASLSEITGQQFIIDNRTGGGGIIAMEAVRNATPDGYTLGQCGISQAIRPALYRKLPFDTSRDFKRVVRYGAVPNLLLVHPSLPARALKDFVAHVKANPGKIDYASSGVGFSPHLTMEFFKTTAGINLVHVPYKSGAQANADVLGGQMKVQFSNLPSQLPAIRAGKLHALAVTSAKRNPELPDVPTFIESGYPGFEVTVWYGLCAPANTPNAATSRLEGAVMKALAMPQLQQKFAAQGTDVVPLGGQAFDRYFNAEMTRWAKVVKDAGIKVE